MYLTIPEGKLKSPYRHNYNNSVNQFITDFMKLFNKDSEALVVCFQLAEATTVYSKYYSQQSAEIATQKVSTIQLGPFTVYNVNYVCTCLCVCASASVRGFMQTYVVFTK